MQLIHILLICGVDFLSVMLDTASSQIPPGRPVIAGPSVIWLNFQITLQCTSSRGSPTPTVKWFKNDTEITTGISTTIAGSVVTTSLTFIASLDYHLEVVECQAENSVLQNPVSTSKFIEVHFTPEPPHLTGPTTLIPGQQGIWTCISANGYPKSTMTMRNLNKNTQFTSEFTAISVFDVKSYDVTGTLTWSPLVVNNGDNICCDVKHATTLGNTPQTVCRQITIYQPISINAPVTKYSPIIQSSVTLQCNVTQGTASQIIWIKNNILLNISSNSRFSGGTVVTESLTIANVQQSDGGYYVCRGIGAGTDFANTDSINVKPVALCEDVQAVQCQQVGINQTTFPNHFDQNSQYEALLVFNGFINDTCSENATLFYCAAFFPRCDEGAVEKPCKDLCLAAMRECGDNALQLFTEKDCNLFNDRYCVRPLPSSPTPTETSTTSSTQPLETKTTMTTTEQTTTEPISTTPKDSTFG